MSQDLNNITIRDNINEIDHQSWDVFVKHHPQGNIFQTSSYFKVMHETPHYKPFVVMAFKGEAVQGVMAGVIQKEIGGLAGYFTSRSVIMGGPLIKDNHPGTLKAILRYYVTNYKKSALYTQIRNIHDQQWAKPVMLEFGFNFEEHLDILIPLNVTEDELLSAMHKSRRRNFTKATNKGVELVEIDHIHQVGQGYEMIRETYDRVKLPCPDKKQFEASFEILSKNNHIKGFLATFEGAVIGIRLVFIYKKMIYDWFAGSSQAERNKYPNDFLIMHILMWGIQNGYDVFDFGGAGHPDEEYGVREHKLKFGGDVVNFGRFQKTHAPLLYAVISRLFKTWRKMKGAGA